MPQDINHYLAEVEDIPGTRVFTGAPARRGFHPNQFAMSLTKPEKRERWKAGEQASQPMAVDERSEAGGVGA